MGLLTSIPQSTINSIEGLIDNSISRKVAAGVYVVRMNGDIDRFDNISNTPIQAAINSAISPSTGVGDYVWCNNWNGYAAGKMEQNIVIKNYINMRFDGGNIFSDSTDNTPLFTDNGIRASIVITGNPILGRYGGAGDNNRCVFKLEHSNSFIRSSAYMVLDSTYGSQNAVISNGNMYLGGDNTIVGKIKTTNGIYYISSNRGTTGLDISGNSQFAYKGICNNITINSGTLNFLGQNSILSTLDMSSGNVFFSNVIFQDACVQYGGISVFTDCAFSVLGNQNYLFPSGGTAKFSSCTFTTDDSYNISIDTNAPVITIDNCKFVGAATNSIYAAAPINIVNYNSYATINKNSNVTLLVDSALTVNANVR